MVLRISASPPSQSDRDAVLQPVRHAHLHQFEVGTHQRGFALQARRAFAPITQERHRRAQVGDEALQHRRGARRAALHQRLHVGQCVEQEVRLDLLPQKREPGIGRLTLERLAFKREGQRLRACLRVALARTVP